MSPRSSTGNAERENPTPQMAVPCCKHLLSSSMGGNDVLGWKTSQVWKTCPDVQVSSIDGNKVYVFFFSSVTWKMFEFSVAYVCLAIGFMMAFMILFSSEEPFKEFPGSLVSVINISVLSFCLLVTFI